jgi:hypothetical protein
MVASWESTIMAPMPHEKPVTTGCGTFWIWRPRRMRPKAIMKTDATMHTFAAPPRPCNWTACAMNGTVALAVPPISTGLRPNTAVIGALTMEVTSPRTGGKPIMEARANP